MFDHSTAQAQTVLYFIENSAFRDFLGASWYMK
jgi:hypothetical protein